MSFVAISKVKFPPALKEAIHAFGLEMVAEAKSQAGLISISFHQSHDENETMMYWEWESQEDHERCMQSEDWNVLMKKSGTLFQSSDVVFSIQTYNRLA
ncbi:putative quinol monooxygenase [Aliikangiella coralliicola]|uniref:ABM domain-containing protein n=1 Tax=Aliikangiella coralliicola TaxID=2592383 RepID=A0A545U5V9_9GAMM|nr:antibiotic biosynthesis monooxygenase [Aliikangiella coralliicola]TQV84859.1 hypothetical protein FLL46_20890 [Aliikangiella coralliicola]